MRTNIFTVLVFFAVGAKAQTLAPAGIVGSKDPAATGNSINMSNDSTAKKKWSFNRYSALSSSFIFAKGGSATVVSAPIGLQVNRMLTNNWYAFANVSVAPAYVSLNAPFMTSGFNKLNAGNSLSPENHLGMYTAASMGLMYVNDAKTFSISGSVSVARGSNPFLPAYPVNSFGIVPARSSTW